MVKNTLELGGILDVTATKHKLLFYWAWYLNNILGLQNCYLIEMQIDRFYTGTLMN